MTSIPFGIFDHVDKNDEPLGVMYEHRLKLLEAADAAGFRGYHVAEHHATRLGMAPSPGIYLAAVAQRTRRIRMGPLVYILPLYPPIRLAQEICMLDHLSGGRFELGVGRGISPYELAYCGINFLEAQSIYEEALEVILAGLATGRLDHRGIHFRYSNVPLVLEPVQRPHPPVWQGVVAPAAAEAAARRGANIVCTAGNAIARGVAERYLECWRGNGDAAAPLVGVLRNIYVAETDGEAVAVARPAYQAWYDSLVSLWRQFNSVPIRFHDNLDRALAHDAAIAGSPATVRAEIERHLAETGANYFVGRFAYGTLSYEQAARSLELFAREVMPHFTKD